jgi:Zn-dependent oligopeptidase
MRQYVQFGNAELPSKNAEHFYTELEVDTLIEDLTEAAEEAIERAAAEAAKAAALAGIEREARALAEAQRWEREYRETRSRGIKNTVITGVICFFAGAAVCGGAIAIYGGR